MTPEEAHLKLLSMIEAQPDHTQRTLAEALGVSLGKTNYCLQALIEKGYIKVGNFRRAPHKQGYLYVLTPSGIRERLKRTQAFLERKQRDYDLLRDEIESLQQQLGAQRANAK